MESESGKRRPDKSKGSTSFAASRHTSGAVFRTSKDATIKVFDRLTRISKGPTGYNHLDKLTINTAFAKYIAINAAVDDGIPVCIFSPAMSMEQLMMHMLLSRARVDASRLRRPATLSDEDWEGLMKAADDLSSAPILIDDTPDISTLELCARTRRIIEERRIGLVIVDYLPLTRARTACWLKALARELDIPIVVLIQLSNRKLGKNADKHLGLSDMQFIAIEFSPNGHAFIPPEWQKASSMYLDTTYCRYDAITKHLYFNLPWSRSMIRACSWSEGCRVDVKKCGGWDTQADAVDLPVVSDLLTGGDNDHPIARYAQDLPREVVRGVAAFAYGQLAMLQVCAASPRGEQLLRSAPVLLWLIAPTLLRQSEGRTEALHDLLGLRQRDLLALYCWRGNSALTRLLAKVPPAIDADRRILTAILAWEEASSLLRLKPKVDWALLRLIDGQRSRISNPVARSIIMSDMEPPAMARALGNLDRIVQDTTNLGQQLGITDAAALVAACTGWRMLRGLHDAWTKRLNSVELDVMIEQCGDYLPPPPLPGTNAIQPVGSVRELLLEGMVMHHCVGSYIDAVRSGTCYIYRVTKPERATLEIQRNQSGVWVQAQLKSYCNGRPGMDVVRQVQKWLGACEPAVIFGGAVYGL